MAEISWRLAPLDDPGMPEFIARGALPSASGARCELCDARPRQPLSTVLIVDGPDGLPVPFLICAQCRKTLLGVKLSRLYTMTVSPVVITGRQNERMPDGLKGIVDSLETFVGTRHRANGRVASVCSAVIFKVANMDDK